MRTPVCGIDDGDDDDDGDVVVVAVVVVVVDAVGRWVGVVDDPSSLVPAM